MSSKFSARLFIKRFTRSFRLASHTAVAIACRQVVDRCRAAKHHHRQFLASLRAFHASFLKQRSSLSPPSASAVFLFPSLLSEYEFNLSSLTQVTDSLAAVIKLIESDPNLSSLLDKLAQVRSTLETQETAYYNTLWSLSPSDFNTAFFYSAELRSMTTKADLCSTDLFIRLRLELAKLATTHLQPVFHLFDRSPLSHLLLPDLKIPKISIPSVNQLVHDLTKVCVFELPASNFAKVTASFHPDRIPTAQPARHTPARSTTVDPGLGGLSGASGPSFSRKRSPPSTGGGSVLEGVYAGIIAPDHLAPADGLAVTRTEVVQVLASLHGFLLVRRCASSPAAKAGDKKNSAGLVPAHFLADYEVDNYSDSAYSHDRVAARS